MASLDALQPEVKENRKVSNELWRQEVSQPWAGGTANSNPFLPLQTPGHRTWTRESRTGVKEPESREHQQPRNGRERDISSLTTVQIRKDFLHAEDCLVTSFPSPCRSSLTTKPPACPLPAQAHQSLLCSSAQEGRLRKVLQNNSAGIRTSSPLKNLEIWTLASHTLQQVRCYCKQKHQHLPLSCHPTLPKSYKRGNLSENSHKSLHRTKRPRNILAGLRHRQGASCLPRNRCLSENSSGVNGRATSHQHYRSSAASWQEFWGSAFWGQVHKRPRSFCRCTSRHTNYF